MTRQEAIEDAYAYVTHKAVDIGSIPADKRALLTKLAVKFYRQWQTEPDMEWNSLYQVVGAGTVSATDSFALDTDINFISTQEQRELNRIRVVHTDGINYTEYDLKRPGELFQLRNQKAVAFTRPDGEATIKFSRAFTADDPEYGGTIQVPAIIKLDDINKDTDEILIDDPEWLSWRMAAQYAFTYDSLRDMYDDLLAAANERMQGMMSRNTTGTETTSTGVDYFSSLGNVWDSY